MYRLIFNHSPDQQLQRQISYIFTIIVHVLNGFIMCYTWSINYTCGHLHCLEFEHRGNVYAGKSCVDKSRPNLEPEKAEFKKLEIGWNIQGTEG